MHVCNCKYKKKTINILHFVIFSVSVYIEFSASIAINCYIINLPCIALAS